MTIHPPNPNPLHCILKTLTPSICALIAQLQLRKFTCASLPGLPYPLHSRQLPEQQKRGLQGHHVLYTPMHWPPDSYTVAVSGC